MFLFDKYIHLFCYKFRKKNLKIRKIRSSDQFLINTSILWCKITFILWSYIVTEGRSHAAWFQVEPEFQESDRAAAINCAETV